MTGSLSFKAKIWLRNNGKAPASWHFVTLPKKTGAEIAKLQKDLPRKGRGSVRVEAQLGFYKRRTSIFPDKKSGSYLLPIKASVHKELQIQEGSEVLIYLTLV